MKLIHTFIIAAAAAVAPVSANGIDFDTCFADSTLRLDYIFSGRTAPDGTQTADIDLASMKRSAGWAGRRNHTADLPLAGNGTVTLRDAETGDTLYRTSFSTLFQEWLTTGEATEVSRAYQHTALVPLPHRRATVTVTLNDSRQRPVGTMTHTVDPADYLIADRSAATPLPHRYIHRGGDSAEAIDVAILAEGYTEAEMDSFYHHAAIAVEALLSHEPFGELAERFNFVAVASPSRDSGVSVPRLGVWKDTAVGSHFSTFYSDRYLTTPEVFTINDLLTGIPYEHVIILANTDEYGGGGIYNSYTLTAARHPLFRPVVVHEFGHSFGGLADEYYYDNDDVTTPLYHTDLEPWEQNLTSLTDFGSKWAHMLPDGAPVPTPPGAKPEIGVFEGGGYCSNGIYRPADECRMRNNVYPSFCPVCRDALRRLIMFYTDK